MLMHEILLTRICALRLQFHFAYLIISNCLLGLGAGGSVLAYNQERWRPDARRQLGRFSLAYAIALVFTYLTLRLWSFPRELELSNPLHLLSLSVYNLVGAMPFFFGGIVVGMLLTFRAEHANRLYAVDLLGAGAGCLLCPLLLPWVGAGGVFVLTVMLAASASIAIDWDRLGKARIPVVLATLIVGLGLLPRLDALLPLPSKGSEFFWLPAHFSHHDSARAALPCGSFHLPLRFVSRCSTWQGLSCSPLGSVRRCHSECRSRLSRWRHSAWCSGFRSRSACASPMSATPG
jgi:hypothetical protein